MRSGKYIKKSQRSVGAIVQWTVGSLLVLTLLSTWLVSGLYARYMVSDSRYDTARVASTGIGKLELWEHFAEETDTNSGIYHLTAKTATGNEYNKVLPGVDIPKDPTISLQINKAEVRYALYVKVTESEPFPDHVTYSLTDDWKCVDSENGIYQYKDIFEANTLYPLKEIQILKDNKLYVSEQYVGSGKSFSLTFNAYLMQETID